MAMISDVTPDEMVTYAAEMGRKITTEEATVALNKALEYMDFYQWVGKKFDKTQPHEWPRGDKTFRVMPVPIKRAILRLGLIALDVEISGEYYKGRLLTGQSQTAPSGASRSFSYNSGNKGDRIEFDWFHPLVGLYLDTGGLSGANFPVWRG